jgi:hypothetical protein
MMWLQLYDETTYGTQAAWGGVTTSLRTEK